MSSYTGLTQFCILYYDQRMHNYFTNITLLHVSTLSCRHQGVHNALLSYTIILLNAAVGNTTSVKIFHIGFT